MSILIIYKSRCGIELFTQIEFLIAEIITSIAENKAVDAKVRISLNHPLLTRARPIAIIDSESLEEIQGAKIDYSLLLQEEFKDPRAFFV